MKSNISKLQLAFTLIELLVVISIIAILASIALPTFTKVIERGNQTKDLSNAKQVYLGLKMYSGDNDGNFPVATGNFSNTAFRELIPNYVPSENVFYLAKSGWVNKTPPDENTVTGEVLKGGENHFAYVNNLVDTSNPNLPLIADGFSDTIGTYSAVETDKGGVWKGRAAVVVRVDGSGKVEKCNAAFQVVGPTGGTTATNNIFTTKTANWLADSQTAVNPEAATAPTP